MKSKVFYSSFDSVDPDFIGIKLKKLMNEAYDFSALKKNTLVPVKLTVGEAASKGNIHPKTVAALINKIRSKGAKPFLTDTNVIYSGRRRNAVDHMGLAYEKGYSFEKLGVPFIVADGLFGGDSCEIQVDFENIKSVKVPPFVTVIEHLFVLSHVTGHMLSGFSASIKNVAMGLASRAGKQIQHSSVKPDIDTGICVGCGCCARVCPADAIMIKETKAFIDKDKCVGCAECIGACKYYAVRVQWEEDTVLFGRKMCEYAAGILKNIGNSFFINFAQQITKECDCINKVEDRIAGDFGIIAGNDPLAVDKATYDLLCSVEGEDKFASAQNTAVHLDMFEYAAKIGLGSLEYELIKVE